MDPQVVKENLIEIWRDLEKIQWIHSTGSSMRPLISDGSQLALQFCKPDKIRLGHIIAFRNGADTVVHRVIGFWNTGERVYFVERGDNNPHCTLIDQSALLGRVVAMKTGRHTLNLKSPLWRALDMLFVLYGWLFTGLFLLLYRIKVAVFGRRKTAWSQWSYRMLQEVFLFLPRNIARIMKRLRR